MFFNPPAGLYFIIKKDLFEQVFFLYKKFIPWPENTGKTYICLYNFIYTAMKKTILLLGLTILSLTASAQKSSFLQKPQVDKRVDLVSIVFRLAGNPEYNYDTVSLYSRRIDEYFAPYRNKLIKFTRPLRNKYGIAYDSPMSIAVHLDSNLNLPGGGAPESLEERWDPKTAKKFAKLVKKFNHDTKYNDFFEANTDDLYAIAIQKFMPVYEQMDMNWFYSFSAVNPVKNLLPISLWLIIRTTMPLYPNTPKETGKYMRFSGLL